MESEDLVGMDRLARSFARQIARMQSPDDAHGAPECKAGLPEEPLWFGHRPALWASPRDASCTPRWCGSMHGPRRRAMCWRVWWRVARLGPGGAAMQERSRDVIAQLNGSTCRMPTRSPRDLR